ncbi:MAG: helix-turn-helix transcriptional regulator, partial [Parvibaculum sp.]|nr:helix-turn-helix transcriptional regulator [Parvibaculum sp.]
MPTSQLVRSNSVARALNLIGDRWALLILDEAFRGTRRFTDWRDRIGIASNVLADRLKRLTAAGCFELVAREGSDKRSEYRLTEMGLDLYSSALMVWRFDKRWSPAGSHMSTLTHIVCGHTLNPQIVCRACRREVKAIDVRYEEGPGAGMAKRTPPRHNRRSSVRGGGDNGARTLFGEAVDLIGDRWTQLVVASLFIGIRRYDDIKNEWKIATNILADRLKKLVEAGVVQRRLYQHGPERYEYVLTPKGYDLYPFVLTLLRWGDRWLADESGPPMILYHKPCGQRLDPVLVCDHCGGELDAHTVKFEFKVPAGSRPAKSSPAAAAATRPAAKRGAAPP